MLMKICLCKFLTFLLFPHRLRLAFLFRVETKFFLILVAVLSIIHCCNGFKDQFRGDVTFHYEWRSTFGSCALRHSKKDPFYVAAMSRFFMKLPSNITNPKNHPFCMEHHCIKVNGKRGSVILKVSDTCSSCKSYDVDVAHKVFPLLDDPNKGRVKMTWNWIDCNKSPPGEVKNLEPNIF